MKSVKKRRILLILFSIACSFFVWIAISLNNQFQTVVEIPLEIEHLAADQSIASPLPKTIRTKIQGTGWQILRATISPTLLLTIDFNDFHKRGLLNISKELIDHSDLPSGIVVIETYPKSIELRLEEKISKTIPILPIVDVHYREGFGIVGNVTLSPESVTITGARTLVNSFTGWRTAVLRLNDVNTPVSTVCRLEDTLHFEIDRSASSATVQFDVQPIAERTINDVPVEIVQVPENKHIVVIPPKISIIIRSGVNSIAGLSEKDFHVYVDYRTILLDTSGAIRPTVTGPEKVKIVQQRPDVIQYVLRK